MAAGGKAIQADSGALQLRYMHFYLLLLCATGHKLDLFGRDVFTLEPKGGLVNDEGPHLVAVPV